MLFDLKNTDRVFSNPNRSTSIQDWSVIDGKSAEECKGI